MLSPQNISIPEIFYLTGRAGDLDFVLISFRRENVSDDNRMQASAVTLNIVYDLSFLTSPLPHKKQASNKFSLFASFVLLERRPART